MPRYLAEPALPDGLPARIGVLLINLGTPDAPTAPALRRYLAEFLSDPRVVEIPRLVWWPILHGIILLTRPKKSAEKYAAIWTPQGSPLRLYTEQQALRLREALIARLPEPVLVEYAMRYGQPSVASVMQAMKAQGCDRLLVLPLYPQHAASSSGTAFDAVFKALGQTRNPPALRTLRSFAGDPGYIAALAWRIEQYWDQNGRPDRLVMSFHGIPKRSVELGDPYYRECQETGCLLAARLGLAPEQYQITFQSRFGPAEWLQPYTAQTLEELGKRKMHRVDVVCPGFVADCLETLEEIAMENKAVFLNAGGSEYHYIPALNDHPAWIAALADLVEAQLQGWL